MIADLNIVYVCKSKTTSKSKQLTLNLIKVSTPQTQRFAKNRTMKELTNHRKVASRQSFELLDLSLFGANGMICTCIIFTFLLD